MIEKENHQTQSPRNAARLSVSSRTGGDEERPLDGAPACGENSGGFGGWRDGLLAVCAGVVLAVAVAMFVASVGGSRGIFSLPLEIALPVSLVGLVLAVWANRRRQRY
jgi:anti-sigma-K factor RskA